MTARKLLADIPRDVPFAKQLLEHFGGDACAVVVLSADPAAPCIASMGVEAQDDGSDVELLVRLLIGLDSIRKLAVDELVSAGIDAGELKVVRNEASVFHVPRKPTGDA